MRNKIIIAVSLVVALLGFSVAAFGMTKPTSQPAIIVADQHEMKTAVQPADSGITTCQEMATRANTPGPKPKLSFADVRAKFEASQDVDIRTAGTKLVDTLEKIDKQLSGDTTGAENVGAVLAMRVAWLDLQEACGKHGVTIPDLKA
jgi:hypothetical protein